MFNSDNVIFKYAGYFLLAFFVAIIVFSFGMPDVSGCGLDRSTAAIVNGEKVHVLEYLRYRDTRFGQLKNQKMDDFILDSFLIEYMMKQKAEKNGIKVTEERITRQIKNMPDFKNPSTGKFDPLYFQALLRNNRMSLAEFEKLIRKDLTISDFRFMLFTGNAVSKEEIATAGIIESSNIQVMYSFLSNEDIRKRYEKDIAVTDAEIDKEIQNSNVKISDPKTDREKIKKQLEEKKLDKIINDISEKINSIASSGGSFSSASALLNGRVLRSAPFRIGAPAKTDDKESKDITALNTSPVFMDKCLSLNINAASPVIKAANGLYIFTPVVKTYKTDLPDKESTDKLRSSLIAGNANMLSRNLMKELSEKSKIVKKLKTN